MQSAAAAPAPKPAAEPEKQLSKKVGACVTFLHHAAASVSTAAEIHGASVHVLPSGWG